MSTTNEEPSEERIVDLTLNSIVYSDDEPYLDITTAFPGIPLGKFKKTIGNLYGWNGPALVRCDIYKVRGRVPDIVHFIADRVDRLPSRGREWRRHQSGRNPFGATETQRKAYCTASQTWPSISVATTEGQATSAI